MHTSIVRVQPRSNPRLMLLRHKWRRSGLNSPSPRRSGTLKGKRGMKSLRTLTHNWSVVGDWLLSVLKLAPKLLIASVLILLSACATRTTPCVLPAAPSSLPVVPPLSAVNTKPMPDCFQRAIESYLENSDIGPVRECVEAIRQWSSTTK